MPQIGSLGVEKEIALHDGLDFVEKQDVEAGSSSTKDNWAYRIEGPEGFVVFAEAGTEFAPEFRDGNGNKLDDSTRIKLQKCDKQGNPLSEYLLSELIGRFDYTNMRTNPDYFRHTKRDMMVNEREIIKIFLDIPEGAEDFSAENSRLTIGDDTSDYGTPAEIVDHDDLSNEELQAVKRVSQSG